MRSIQVTSIPLVALVGNALTKVAMPFGGGNSLHVRQAGKQQNTFYQATSDYHNVISHRSEKWMSPRKW
jgi:hypothetical protein